MFLKVVLLLTLVGYISAASIDVRVNLLEGIVLDLEHEIVELKKPDDRECKCVTSTVNIRETACGTIRKAHNINACFKATGNSELCVLGSTTYNFIELDYDGQGTSGWVADGYITNEPQSRCEGMGVLCSSSDFVTRSDWGASTATSSTALSTPLSAVFIHHSAGPTCDNRADCITRVKGIQDFHINGNGWSDIGYNFLVGDDGAIYEARGWTNEGAHASGHNGESFGICYMGNFDTDTPSVAALHAIKSIMQCGVDQGYLTPGFEVFGHKDAGSTACPGTNLYSIIQSWPYYSYRNI